MSHDSPPLTPATHGDNAGESLCSIAWLDAAEVKAVLLSTLRYYECDDKDDFFYMATAADIEILCERMVATGRAKASNPVFSHAVTDKANEKTQS